MLNAADSALRLRHAPFPILRPPPPCCRRMSLALDVLQTTICRLDPLLLEVTRRAGAGADPDVERRLDLLARRLSLLLEGVDDACFAAARDTIEAAKRVMDAADPEAPLLMLRLARDNLARALRRHDMRGDLAAAA